MRTKLVIGNWKMNGQLAEVTQLTAELKKLIKPELAHNTVLLPPAVYLPLVQQELKGTQIKLGAQNIYPKVSGAYTGELSAPMLQDFGCLYVLVGHSERRHYFKEDENFVAQKFHHAKEHGMIPVLCVGETLSERENGQTEQVISRQLQAVIDESKNCFSNCIIAYEPVWAIGTGKTALPEQAQEVHQFIRSLVREVNSSDAEGLTLLYGGSVNPNNAKALFTMPDIDGGLVGGASLNAKQFVDIVTCIN